MCVYSTIDKSFRANCDGIRQCRHCFSIIFPPFEKKKVSFCLTGENRLHSVYTYWNNTLAFVIDSRCGEAEVYQMRWEIRPLTAYAVRLDSRCYALTEKHWNAQVIFDRNWSAFLAIRTVESQKHLVCPVVSSQIWDQWSHSKCNWLSLIVTNYLLIGFHCNRVEEVHRQNRGDFTELNDYFDFDSNL